MAKHTKNAGHTPAGKAAKPSAAAGRTAPKAAAPPPPGNPPPRPPRPGQLLSPKPLPTTGPSTAVWPGTMTR